MTTTQGGVEYRGRLTTLGLTCANIDIINDSGVIVAQYLRRITKKLDLGVEFIHQYGIPIPGRQLSVVNYQARYTGKNFIASGMFSFDALHLCYYHKQRENISFGVEFESSTRSGEAVTTIGYQAEIPDEGVIMRASVNTDWSVGAVFEKKLSRNLPFTLAISGMLNHVKGQGKFGIGLIIG
ncbi:mitochondrial import receptor subunit tom40 [Wuchereria bancrofti]|uniref:Mitochondrial import receptor subunit tom40 n=1 Tax=Wuchereria bancrofti TaxID=6293 RepID=J9BEI8_WUCBA|nr:mitochondrial import receptor subunit tom40 [Wuchereria bancrofti]